MGLAASQARFLAITSRKAYCEFESMQIAQEKLSVTRDLAKISEDYQNALNKTKLVWDYDGTGTNPYNLSYGVLMTPTTLNNYNPYLITTRTGSVVLNSQLAAAASVISPTGTATTASESGYKQFVAALAANGVIPESTAEDISDTETLPYSKDAGYGGTPLNKNGASASNIVGLTYAVKDINIGSILSELIDSSGKLSNDNTLKVTVNGTDLSKDQLAELTLDELLTNDVIIREQGEDSEDSYSDFALADILKQFFEEVNEGFKGILGTDEVSKQSLNIAKDLTYKNFSEVKNIDADKISNTASWNRAKENIGYNQIVFVKNSGKKNNSTVGVSLSNMISYYLTEFELLLNGYNSSYSLGQTADSSNFVTDDPYYNYVMKDSDSVDSVTVMQADFYMQLYNNICANGWTQNDNIEDNNYLENALKNGTYFITSLNEDGYFYQGRYNEEDCIIEIKDEDAIAQAEAEFSTKKTQLTYKEDKLDLDMKNLDTEISSLTTEYDSVKNLISKNVEKVFTMFQ